MKEYGELFADDPAWAERARAFSAKVRDVSEVLVRARRARGRRGIRSTARVVYHDACHLAHAQGVRAQPRALLTAIPGVDAVAGRRSRDLLRQRRHLQPRAAGAGRGARRAQGAHLAALEPDIIATGNPGCMLQIAAAARSRGLDVAGRPPGRAPRRVDSRRRSLETIDERALEPIGRRILDTIDERREVADVARRRITRSETPHSRRSPPRRRPSCCWDSSACFVCARTWRPSSA